MLSILLYKTTGIQAHKTARTCKNLEIEFYSLF